MGDEEVFEPKKKILVQGVSGYIGGNIAKRFQAEGFEVLGTLKVATDPKPLAVERGLYEPGPGRRPAVGGERNRRDAEPSDAQAGRRRGRRRRVSQRNGERDRSERCSKHAGMQASGAVAPNVHFW